MFNPGQYFFTTPSLGTVRDVMYRDVVDPLYYHCGKYEAARVRALQQITFRPDGDIVRQPRDTNTLRDF
jgi:hypothetical protein